MDGECLSPGHIDANDHWVWVLPAPASAQYHCTQMDHDDVIIMPLIPFLNVFLEATLSDFIKICKMTCARVGLAAVQWWPGLEWGWLLFNGSVLTIHLNVCIFAFQHVLGHSQPETDLMQKSPFCHAAQCFPVSLHLGPQRVCDCIIMPCDIITSIQGPAAKAPHSLLSGFIIHCRPNFTLLEPLSRKLWTLPSDFAWQTIIFVHLWLNRIWGFCSFK